MTLTREWVERERAFLVKVSPDSEKIIELFDYWLATHSDGMVLVPREPTKEMIEAGCKLKLKRLHEFAGGKDGGGIKLGVIEDYKAMLAARPVAKEEPENDGGMAI